MQWGPPNPNLKMALAQLLGPAPTPIAQPPVSGFPGVSLGADASSLGGGGPIDPGPSMAGGGGGGGGGSLDLSGVFSQLASSGVSGGDGSSGQEASGARTNVAAWVKPPDPKNPFVANAASQQQAHEQRQAALAAQQAAESRRRQQQRNAQMFSGVSTGFGAQVPQSPQGAPRIAQPFAAPVQPAQRSPMQQAFAQVFPGGPF